MHCLWRGGVTPFFEPILFQFHGIFRNIFLNHRLIFPLWCPLWNIISWFCPKKRKGCFQSGWAQCGGRGWDGRWWRRGKIVRLCSKPLRFAFSLVSTYVVCEGLSVMQRQARLPEFFDRIGQNTLFWNLVQNTSPFPPENLNLKFKFKLLWYNLDLIILLATFCATGHHPQQLS